MMIWVYIWWAVRGTKKQKKKLNELAFSMVQVEYLNIGYYYVASFVSDGGDDDL